ncbi:hypothetical protein Q5P01_010263 [Channa striata]|uniref:Galaxin-like repeats domain-containing protein n=1 Tax=Channa striata TaxID=64152 RepID=A0AA88MXH6_CHASR|nr:hypothetical protein Q5P01_010263 [Channa striata]
MLKDDKTMTCAVDKRSTFYGLPGQHCCGGEIFRPDDEICCNGHRHPKGKNVYCCGVNAYNIEDPHMKCCSGTLYNVTSLDNHGHNAQCCGSLLQSPKDVCCSSDEEQLLYSAKTGFRCCGHHYYNTSLWSCCAGMLRPVHQPGHHEGKRIKVHIGIVESVSPHSIVFSTVLKINGRTGSVRAVSPHYILKLSDHCSSPKLTPGKTYFFNDANVFTDFNQENILHSVHLIFAKCYRP